MNKAGRSDDPHGAAVLFRAARAGGERQQPGEFAGRWGPGSWALDPCRGDDQQQESGGAVQNGVRIKSGMLPLPATLLRGQNYIGQSDWPSGASVAGQLAGATVECGAIRSGAANHATSRPVRRRAACLATGARSASPGQSIGQVADHSPTGLHGTLSGGARIALTNDLPVRAGCHRQRRVQHAGFRSRRPGQKQAMMRRFFGGRVLGAVMLLPDKRIEAAGAGLGQQRSVRANPARLHRGAPPVPSENLTGVGTITARPRSSCRPPTI